MNLIGRRVNHPAKYGKGTIVAERQGIITVKFDKPRKEVSFMKDTCFDAYLELLDSSGSDIQKIGERTGFVADNQISNNVFLDALTTEMNFLKSSGEKRHKLFNGTLITQTDMMYSYTFETDVEIHLPAGTQLNLWRNSEKFSAILISSEEYQIILTTAKNFGQTVEYMEFSAESWRLLDALKQRLQEISIQPSAIVQSLMHDGPKKIMRGSEMYTGQETAIKMALNQPITFIWGPPGTGKTETLAQIARTAVKQKMRVLMMSYSNVSVDGAAIRVFEKNKKIKPGVLVRYGYPRDSFLLEHPYLTSYQLALYSAPELAEERKTLLDRIRKMDRKSKEYLEIRKRLNAIQESLREKTANTARDARIVITTVSKAVVDETIYNQQFDVVIFDEASMAYVPQILFSAGLAAKHFVCIGDFNQLPPIVQSGKADALTQDIFHYCGIVDALKKGYGHEWLCLLDTQYRMHSDIAAFVNKEMYFGNLQTAPEIVSKREKLANAISIVPGAIGLVDLSRMPAFSMRGEDYSRFNVLSAMISFYYAIKSADKYPVGIISPYQTQAKLLHAMAIDLKYHNPELQPISSATVHQFQGSEKDMIIYDAVESYGSQRLGKLISSTKDAYSNRLFNVAVTRARGKFLMVANRDYFRRKELPGGLLFSRCMQACENENHKVSGQELEHLQNVDNKCLTAFYAGMAYKAYLADIDTAKAEIRVDIPRINGVPGQYLKQLAISLNDARKRGVKIYVRAYDKTAFSAELKKLAVSNEKIQQSMIMIDKKLVWVNLFAEYSVIEMGNVRLTPKYSVAFRFFGGHTAKLLYGLLNMADYVDKTVPDQSVQIDSKDTGNLSEYVSTLKCKKCGKPMKLAKSMKSGKRFIACSDMKCGETGLITEKLVEDYLSRTGEKYGQRCPICRASLTAKLGKYGVYVECCNDDPHRFSLDQI